MMILDISNDQEIDAIKFNNSNYIIVPDNLCTRGIQGICISKAHNALDIDQNPIYHLVFIEWKDIDNFVKAINTAKKLWENGI